MVGAVKANFYLWGLNYKQNIKQTFKELDVQTV